MKDKSNIKDRKILVCLTNDLYNDLKAYAQVHAYSNISWVVREAIEKHINQKESETNAKD